MEATKSEDKKLVPELRFKEFDSEWTVKNLGSVATFHDNERVPLSESERNARRGDIPYYGASGIIDYVDDYLFDGEYVLLGEDGANILNRSTRLAFLINGKNWVNNHAHVLKAKGSNYFLSESLERISYEKYNTGTAQPKLNAAVCKSIKINLPTLPEQQKIASFLRAVDQKVQQLTQKAALLEQYKKGVMQQLFSGALRFKDEDGKSYPDWKWLGGNKLFDNISDKNHISDLPILAITQDQGAIPRDMIDYQMTVSEKSVASYKVVQKGDFVISLRTFQGGIEYSEYHGICSPAYIILRPSSDNVDRQFYKFYLKTTYYIKQLQKNLEGIRDGKMISYKYFSEIKLPFPSLAEQQKIANFLSGIDAKIVQVNQQLEHTQTFKKGLLQKMFV